MTGTLTGARSSRPMIANCPASGSPVGWVAARVFAFAAEQNVNWALSVSTLLASELTDSTRAVLPGQVDGGDTRTVTMRSRQARKRAWG